MGRFDSFPEQLMAFFMLGFPLAALLMLAVLGGLVWSKAWAWIDDSEPGRNPVNDMLARLRGWTPYTTESGSYFWWKDKKGETKCDVIFAYAFTTLLLPLATFLSIKFYPLLLTVLTLLLLAYVARFARRHKKLFDKHLKDPEAHK
jgi:hypothetical protein